MAVVQFQFLALGWLFGAQECQQRLLEHLLLAGLLNTGVSPYPLARMWGGQRSRTYGGCLNLWMVPNPLYTMFVSDTVLGCYWTSEEGSEGGSSASEPWSLGVAETMESWTAGQGVNCRYNSSTRWILLFSLSLTGDAVKAHIVTYPRP